jgi:hypothetical protein
MWHKTTRLTENTDRFDTLYFSQEDDSAGDP